MEFVCSAVGMLAVLIAYDLGKRSAGQKDQAPAARNRLRPVKSKRSGENEEERIQRKQMENFMNYDGFERPDPKEGD